MLLLHLRVPQLCYPCLRAHLGPVRELARRHMGHGWKEPNEEMGAIEMLVQMPHETNTHTSK